MKKILTFLSTFIVSTSIIAPTVQSCNSENIMLKDFPNTDLGFLPDLKESTIKKAIKNKNPNGDMNFLELNIKPESARLAIAGPWNEGKAKYKFGEEVIFTFISKIIFIENNDNNSQCKIKNKSNESCKVKLDINSDDYNPEIDTLPVLKWKSDGVTLVENYVDLKNKIITFEIGLDFNFDFKDIENIGFAIDWHDVRFITGKINII